MPNSVPLHVFFPCFGTKTVLFLERESCIRHSVKLVYTSSMRQALAEAHGYPSRRLEVYQKFFLRSNEKVDGDEAVQNKRMKADIDGEVENELKKITYYFYCIHSDCTVCFITEDFLYCVYKETLHVSFK